MARAEVVDRDRSSTTLAGLFPVITGDDNGVLAAAGGDAGAISRLNGDGVVAGAAINAVFAADADDRVVTAIAAEAVGTPITFDRVGRFGAFDVIKGLDADRLAGALLPLAWLAAGPSPFRSPPPCTMAHVRADRLCAPARCENQRDCRVRALPVCYFAGCPRLDRYGPTH